MMMRPTPYRKRRRPGITSILLCANLLAFSNHVFVVVIAVVEASPQGGVLPPPPPPPPPPPGTTKHPTIWELDRSREVNEDDESSSSIISNQISLVEKSNDEWKSSLPSTPDSNPAESTDDTTNATAGEDALIPIIKSDSNELKTTNSVWESNIAPQWQYQPQSNLMAQPWGTSEQTPSQYTDRQWQQQHHHQQPPPPPPQQHQQQQSWGQRHQQPRQQLNFRQQQQLQQHWSYQSQHRQQPQPQWGPQPSGQVVALYHKPSPPAVAARAKKSASILFSLAAKKLQAGIDTVSDTLDANKVVSSVTSLTSRIGTIGSSIANGSGGGHTFSTPRKTMVPGTNRMSSSMAANNAVHPGMRRPPPNQPQPRGTSQYAQQRTTPPGPAASRPVKKESYAPPISELFPMEQHNVNSDGIVDGDFHANEDSTDSIQSDVRKTLDEDKIYPDRTDASKSQSAPPLLQPRLSSNDDDDMNMEPIPFQGASPRSNISPPQQGRRSTPPSSYSRTSKPMPNSPNTGSRRRDRDCDEDDDSSLGQKLKSILGACIPRVPTIFRSSDVYDDGSWSDDEANEISSRGGGIFSVFSRRKDVRMTSTSSSRSRHNPTSGRSPLVPRPVQSLLEKRETLLSTASTRKCASIGRSQAVLDAGQLALVVYMLHEIVPIFFRELLPNIGNVEFKGGKLRLAVISTLFSALDGWVPYALAAAFLLSVSNKVWMQPALEAAFLEAASENASDAAYTQLYLRLIASIPIQASFSSEVLKETARYQAFQISSSARLRYFVMILVLYILLSTVAVLRPAFVAVASATTDVIKLNAWREAPIDVTTVFVGVKNIAKSLGYSLYTLIVTEMEEIRHQPLLVTMIGSLLAALISVSYFPSIEKRRKKFLPPRGEIDGENTADEYMYDTITSLWSNLGSSSATRLGLLSSPRGVEGALDQFTKLRPDRAAAAGIANVGRTSMLARRQKRRRHLESSSFKPILKKVLYSSSAFAILSVPLAAYIYLLKPSDAVTNGIGVHGWVSLLELATLLAFAYLRTGDAMRDVTKANNLMLGSSVTYFFQKLLDTVTEVKKLASESSSGADFQAMLTASPTKGITVTDFWAAHSSRRAWATKGANIKCLNGEVVLIIGDDGGGKTRLLTAITEQIFTPPKLARSTTYVRGSINIGGVELPKWDKLQLQNRVGVFLNDVRTISDYSSLLAGCTLEEILEPVNASGRTSPKEKNSMSVATKITGLGSKVLTRLPSKLSTVVVANEDDLMPSSTRPPAYPLSPSDWSRVLLTKILAQLLSGNDSQPTAPGTVRKSLIGSILLLDDATSQMSEVDEANVINALRSTGAATLLTSNRWATGRMADRIVVVDAGSVVEFGTHSELLNLGPERSLYARKWGAMSSI